MLSPKKWKKDVRRSFDAAATPLRVACSETDRAARTVQAGFRRVSSGCWMKVLDRASSCSGVVGFMQRRLLAMGDAGGRAAANLVVACSSGGDDVLARARKRALICLLRSSVKLASRCLKALLPQYLTPSRLQAQEAIAALHNSGRGMPLGAPDSEGPAKNFTLEVLRMDADGRLWRRVAEAHGSCRYEPVASRGCVSRRPSHAFDTEPVSSKGLIKRFTCRVETRIVEPERGLVGRVLDLWAPTRVSAAEPRSQQQEAQGRDLVSEYADAYLAKKYPAPLARCLQRAIPRRLKSVLDFDYPPDFLPRAMRDNPSEVISLDLDLDLAVRLDSREPLFDVSAMKLGDFTSTAKHENDVRLVFFVRGHNGFPSLGTLELRSLRLEAAALAWWDVFDGAIDLAFKKDEPLRIAWDIEVGLGGAHLPLPSCVEDSFLAWLTGVVMRSFNRAYPLHVELAPVDADPQEPPNGRLSEAQRASTSGPPVSARRRWRRSKTLAAAGSAAVDDEGVGDGR